MFSAVNLGIPVVGFSLARYRSGKRPSSDGEEHDDMSQSINF
jgi:hypothetical protein